MNEVIGILGYGGKMGSALTSIIPKQLPIKLGQRHIRYIDRENVEYQQVDICDAVSMRAFTKGITILINCAGPSLKLLDFAAKAAAEAGIPYVDAFGGDILEERLRKSGLKGSFVLNAGSFPGLTGAFPIEMANRYFEHVECFSLELNNHENWGKASALDLVFSAIHHYGKANYYYKDGTLILCEEDATPDAADGFSKSEYINQETVAIAEMLGASEAHLIQVRADMQEGKDLQQTIQQYIMTGNDHLLESKLENNGVKQIEDEYFKLSCNMKGVGKHHEETVLEELTFANSYLAGGVMLFHCINRIFALPDRLSLGIKSAYEVAEGALLLEECVAFGAERMINITETEEMEEGDL